MSLLTPTPHDGYFEYNLAGALLRDIPSLTLSNVPVYAVSSNVPFPGDLSIPISTVEALYATDKVYHLPLADKPVQQTFGVGYQYTSVPDGDGLPVTVAIENAEVDIAIQSEANTTVVGGLGIWNKYAYGPDVTEMVFHISAFDDVAVDGNNYTYAWIAILGETNITHVSLDLFDGDMSAYSRSGSQTPVDEDSDAFDPSATPYIKVVFDRDNSKVDILTSDLGVTYTPFLSIDHAPGFFDAHKVVEFGFDMGEEATETPAEYTFEAEDLTVGELHHVTQGWMIHGNGVTYAHGLLHSGRAFAYDRAVDVAIGNKTAQDAANTVYATMEVPEE